MEVLIKRCGTLLQLAAIGGEPLPPPVQQIFETDLAFDKKLFLRGHNRHHLEGSRANITVERRLLHQITNNYFVTGFGMLTRVVKLCERYNLIPRYVDLSPPRRRPNCYVSDMDNVLRHFKFRPRQEECLRTIEANECGLINAPMGFGKTALFEATCLFYPRAKIHIVCDGADVAKTTVAQLTRVISDVGLIGAGSDRMGHRVTVFTAGSIHKTDGDADFLLCDEAHKLVTDNIGSKLTRGWSATRNFAFTATPTARMDDADAYIELFFGPQIFYMSYQEAVALGLVVPIRVRWLSINISPNPCKNMTDVLKMKEGIWRNHDRNAIIAADVRANYPDPNTQVLILCATMEHAVHMWQHLPEFSLCYGSQSTEDIEYYKRHKLLPDNFQETSSEMRERYRQEFRAGTLKRVIATDVWATGVDFAMLQVLYRIDARSSEILDAQAPGRVSRISHATGKTYGEVVDCWDSFDNGLKGKSMKRRAHYKKLGWDQVFSNIPRLIG